MTATSFSIEHLLILLPGIAEGITLAVLILVIGYAILNSSLSPLRPKSQTSTRQTVKKEGTVPVEILLPDASIQKPVGLLSGRWSSPGNGRSSRKVPVDSSASLV
jgi:hypothetical protein